MADFYETLAVSRTASADEIKKAYLRLARERHPDRFQDPVEKERAQEFFKELTEAYNTLRDDRSRRSYDQTLAQPAPTSPDEIAANAMAEGQRLAQQNALQEAAEQFRIALYHRSGDARVHAALGRVLLRTRDGAREGVQELEKAVQLAPNQAALHAELATALLAQGLKLRARKTAEVALKLAPDSADVRRVATEVGLFDPPAGGASDGGEGGGLLSRLRRKP
jgi:DnaJ-class molecular chaperone